MRLGPERKEGRVPKEKKDSRILRDKKISNGTQFERLDWERLSPGIQYDMCMVQTRHFRVEFIFLFSRHRGSARRETPSLVGPHPRPPGLLGEPARQDTAGVVRHPADGVGGLLRAAGQVPRELCRREQAGLPR